MFSFFKKKTPPAPAALPAAPSAAPPAAPALPAAGPARDALARATGTAHSAARASTGGSMIGSQLVTPIDIAALPAIPPERQKWLDKLKAGLGKTASSISGVFGGTQINEALFEDLESALLMADAGVAATEHLITELRRKVKDHGITHPVALKNSLIASLTQMLQPLEKPLVIGQYKPTVIMVVGVNGAGKTTSIGKLTRHLSEQGASVLLAAADTFRAAAREQLTVWADRNTVEIISQEGGDPAAVSFDAVSAGKARGKDVVLVDTAGRLPTQLHLMEELKKIKRVIQKAGVSDTRVADGPPLGDTAPRGLRPAAPDVPAHIGTGQRASASGSGLSSAAHEMASVGANIPPHEILLVIDGNTGQNALTQVRAFDDALQLTGLIITKLDGTAKGGVLAAIARERPIPVYFIGVGEKLEELETFNAREFAQALLA